MVHAISDLFAYRQLIVELVEKSGLPAIYPGRGYVEAGGLMAYGSDGRELWRRMADDVHDILNGAKPGDIPIFQPTKFEFVINLKAAKALGPHDPAGAARIRRRGDRMRRREFITIFAGAAGARQRNALAQQSAVPVIGFLSSASPNAYAGRVTAFRKGLNESGYIDGRDVAIEFRWAQGQYDRLPVFAADLVRQNVAVIVSSGGDVAALSAKAATSSIPIVTVSGTDPVKAGLVASFNPPGGNVTGASFVATELETKRLELLRDLVPAAAMIGILINPANPAAESRSKDLQIAARTLEREIHIVSASNESDLETAFATLIQQRAGALLVSTDSFFTSQRDRLVAVAARHALPTIYAWREFVEAGGLASYGPIIDEVYRQAGIYTARILKGEKPADLPFLRPTKFELVVNLKTAATLGLTLPQVILARADEVIE
jgi:putative ABC transport system substrate-binding protein